MLDQQHRKGGQDKRGLPGRSARPVGLGLWITNQQGFTLVELVLTIILVGIIAGMASVFLRQGLNAFVAEDARADITNQGRLAMERMAREIRVIRSRTAADLPGCCTNPSTSLNFFDTSGSNIVYAVAGNTVTRNGTALAAGSPILLNFRYYQQDGTTLATTAAQVWSIQIDLTVTRNGESQAYRVRVHPRNFV
ncbi:MAG: type II secretion system protein [Candidatus Manganitrophus sp.]|nr:type II secretion system protein [Candidatus Manganitrophus sp.]MDC4223499.1 type II secretion system protein [Candidatus Manganitrophus sp.]WDT70621.1 MAG: type II secretion system protein [Candidatus Manganitrophus sp.]WDT82120.1 MAG: type II secretion system protein [Candidatus Manganitrophus sp.]